MWQSLTEKRELAWLVTRKHALLALFGYEHAAHLWPLAFEELQLAALALFHHAIQAGLFTHGSFIEDRLTELNVDHGWAADVPYTEEFEQQFPLTVATYDLLAVTDYLVMLCRDYGQSYPTFFQAEASGYTYLSQLLLQTQHQHTVPTTPSLTSALAWLTQRAGGAEHPVFRPDPGLPAHSAPETAAPDWAGILVGAHTRAEVEALLQTLSLLEDAGSGRLVLTAEAKAGAWVGVLLALQEGGYLSRNKEALARVVRASYGPVVSARALQIGLKPDNERQYSVYQRTKAYLTQQATRR